MSRYICAILLSLSFVASVPSSAQVPRVLSYQGTLSDSEASPVNEPVRLTFRLFDRLTGGTSLWEEVHEQVPVSNGSFDLTLGETTPIDITFDGPTWLEIQVNDSAPLSPRTRLTASPYSLHALSVSDGAVTEDVIADETVVRSINGLRDVVTLVAGDNVTVFQEEEGEIIISASVAGAGSSLPAEGTGATIAGGTDNVASGDHAAVGGGESNAATNAHSTIAGGRGNIASGFESAILGGKGNSATGFQAVVGGGDVNNAVGACTFLGGGAGNIVFGRNAFAGAGWRNFVTDQGGVIAGGRDNKTGAAIRQPDLSFSGGSQVEFGAIVGGELNLVSRSYGFIGGGRGNTISGAYGVIGGGHDNIATGTSVVGGGGNNKATGFWSTVPGGELNEARGSHSFAAGRAARVLEAHDGTFVWADAGSETTPFQSTGPNQFLIRATGGVGIGTNTPTASLQVGAGDDVTAESGGYLVLGEVAGLNIAMDGNEIMARNSGTVAPLHFQADGGPVIINANGPGHVGIGTDTPGAALDVVGTVRAAALQIPTGAAIGRVLTSDANGVASWQSPTAGLRVEETTESPNVIGGFGGNIVTGGTVGATIGGGGSGVSGSTSLNRVTDVYGTVSGGQGNRAGDDTGPVTDNGFATVGGGWRNTSSGNTSFIGGGLSNEASGTTATISGGSSNVASGSGATVGGGNQNEAVGGFSTVPGGTDNIATGDFSFAAGRNAIVAAGHHGTYVWADHTNEPFQSTGQDQYLIRASGGVGINTNAPQVELDVAGTVAATEFRLGTGPVGLSISGLDDRVTWKIGGQNLIDARFNRLRLERFDSSLELGATGTRIEGGSLTFSGTLVTIDAVSTSFDGIVQLPATTQYQGQNLGAFITTQAVAASSDARLKTDVRSLRNTLESIGKIRGVRYRWKDRKLSDPSIGVIAQEVETVYPELVFEGTDGNKRVAYGHLSGVLVSAVNELNAKVDKKDEELRRAYEEIDQLRARMEALETAVELVSLRLGPRTATE